MRKVLSILKIPESSWYRNLKPLMRDNLKPKKKSSKVDHVGNQKIIEQVIELKNKPFLSRVGYRKVVQYLKRDFGVVINHKRLYKLMKAESLLNVKAKKVKRRGKKKAIRKEVHSINELWQFDIKYVYISDENVFCYLMVFIDVFSRKIVDYHIGKNYKASDIAFTLKQALIKSGAKAKELMIRSDNGQQMTSKMFEKEVSELKLKHEFIAPGNPNENVFVESFFSVLDYELLNDISLSSYSEVYSGLIDYIDFYNNKRIYGSLKNKSPIEFEQLCETRENAS